MENVTMKDTHTPSPSRLFAVTFRLIDVLEDFWSTAANKALEYIFVMVFGISICLVWLEMVLPGFPTAEENMRILVSPSTVFAIVFYSLLLAVSFMAIEAFMDRVHSWKEKLASKETRIIRTLEQRLKAKERMQTVFPFLLFFAGISLLGLFLMLPYAFSSGLATFVTALHMVSSVLFVSITLMTKQEWQENETEINKVINGEEQ